MHDLSSVVVVIFLLLLLCGVLAMAEVAILSARKSRLKQLADDGNARARLLLELIAAPERFLAAVQMGSALIGVLAGALGGSLLADGLAEKLDAFPWLAPYARPFALGVVVIGIALCMVVLGELAPKRIGLRMPESIGLVLAGPIRFFSALVSPLTVLLTWLTALLLRPFGLARATREALVSDAEVNSIIAEGLHAGVFNQAETEMVAGVLELDKLEIAALMTPRPKIVFLNIGDPEETNWRKIITSGHSHFPVYHGNRDQIIGIVSVKSIWANSAFGLPTNLKNLLVPPVVVPETMKANALLEQFKKTGQHIALVSDEFGSIQGLITLIDVFEAIVGDIPQSGRRAAPDSHRREDGSWVINATLPVAEFKEMLGLARLPHEEQVDFQTLGGFVMTHFGHIPREGDHFDLDGWRIEVAGMDRHRVDKVVAAKILGTAGSEK